VIPTHQLTSTRCTKTTLSKAERYDDFDITFGQSACARDGINMTWATMTKATAVLEPQLRLHKADADANVPMQK